MKAVLLSIQPKYCELIANGEKTVEIRKNRPKIDVPFKCYIYCTKGDNPLVPPHLNCTKYEIHKQLGRKKWKGSYKDSDYKFLNGKVIGEFVCDAIIIDRTFGHDEMLNTIACLNIAEISAYCTNDPMYAWHISDLVIYDEPKELNKFNMIDKKAVKECEFRKRAYTNPDYTNGVCLPGSYICTKESETDWCSKCRIKPLNRPPQSWCYVEELEANNEAIL